ncbi:MAG: hypothetical protein ONB07_01220 [candidate division KSB1 bacterium]|nr:hypothetical protein [candidate division KSB1 bacterium]MDZ7392295.1 hypothetical protein [candidate division KSB1 bacterium]MDZ7412200.1 hypothetical protein [candidate division KSB1 bacterium]
MHHLAVQINLIFREGLAEHFLLRPGVTGASGVGSTLFQQLVEEALPIIDAQLRMDDSARHIQLVPDIVQQAPEVYFCKSRALARTVAHHECWFAFHLGPPIG